MYVLLNYAAIIEQYGSASGPMQIWLGMALVLIILEAARREGIATEEASIRPQALAAADEIFLSGTPFKVLPVHRYEDCRLEPAPGAVTLKLQRAMDRIVRGEDPRFGQWLFPVR